MKIPKNKKKSILLMFSLLIIILNGCTNPNAIIEAKEKLKQCYERKCNLIIEEADLKLDYPFEFCYYESRKECINEISEYLSVSFCDDFTYKKLCYEDLAVVKRNKEICYEAYKPTKDDELFEEYVKQNQDRSEDELFEEYSKDFKEYNPEFNYCNAYYDMAIRVIDSSISHCEGESYTSAIHCYANLISEFKSVRECDKYRDMLKRDSFGIIALGDSTANNCYWWYAVIHEDISICDTMDEHRDWCLQRYANAKCNSSYCQGIEHPVVKEVCEGDACNQGTKPGCLYYHGIGEMCFGRK